MNNSQIIFEEEGDAEDYKTSLTQRQSESVKIIEAIKRVADSRDWQTLKRLLFDGVIETLERQLKSEATKAEIATPELYRLQGQLVWARKYADLNKLIEFFRQQVEGIKLNLKK